MRAWLASEGKAKLAAIVVVAVTLLSAESAMATCADPGSATSLGPVGAASATATWNGGGTRHLTLGATADSTLNVGICADAWFDWRATSGGSSHHYDARLARTCEPSSSRYFCGQTGGCTEPSNAVTLHEPQKLAAARWVIGDHLQPASSCANVVISGTTYYGNVIYPSVPGGPDNTVGPQMPNDYTDGWIRYRDGTNHIFDGGNPTDPNA